MFFDYPIVPPELGLKSPKPPVLWPNVWLPGLFWRLDLIELDLIDLLRKSLIGEMLALRPGWIESDNSVSLGLCPV